MPADYFVAPCYSKWQQKKKKKTVACVNLLGQSCRFHSFTVPAAINSCAPYFLFQSQDYELLPQFHALPAFIFYSFILMSVELSHAGLALSNIAFLSFVYDFS